MPTEPSCRRFDQKTSLARVTLLVFSLGLRGFGAAPETGPAKLRELIQLPQVHAEVGLGFNSTCGFFFGKDNRHPDLEKVGAEMEVLKQQLAGSTADAARYRRLGDLYLMSDDPTNALAVYKKAVGLYRKRLEEQGENGPLLAEFGQALWGANLEAEAESALRKSVRVAPKQWKSWTALGKFLDDQGNRALPNTVNSRRDRRMGSFNFSVGLPNRASGNELAEAKRRYAEAERSFDRAVALAPHEPEIYTARSIHRMNQNFQLAIHQGAGEPVGLPFTPDALNDLWEAARLSPTNYLVVTAAAFFEASANGLLQAAKTGQPPERLLEILPAQSKQHIREALTALDDLTRSPDSQLAAGALLGRGLLRLYVFPDPACLDDFRRSIALDPARDQLWDVVTAMMAGNRQFDEAISFCQRRLTAHDTAQNRLLLAKVYFLSGKYAKAEIQLRTAVKLDPNHFNSVIGLAELIMKQRPEAGLPEAQPWLLKAKALCQQSLHANQTDREPAIEYLLTAAIYAGLAGQPDEARACLKTVLEWEADNGRAKAILAALDRR